MARTHRWARWYLTAVGVLVAFFGVGDVRGGITVDPGITKGLSGLTPEALKSQDPVATELYDFTTRSQGLALLAIGILLASIALVPYGDGRRWAWYAMWVVPGWSFAVAALYINHGMVPGESPPPPVISGPIVGGLTVLALVLDRPRFFEHTGAVGPLREAT